MTDRREANGAGVNTSNIPELFNRLSTSILLQSNIKQCDDGTFLSFLEEGNKNRRIHLPWVTKQTLSKKLRAVALNVVLLRQWEWLHTEEQELVAPHCQCMAHVLFLQHHGQPELAAKLMEKISCILSPSSSLSDPQSVLHFLYLLSHMKSNYNVTVHKPKDWIYDVYPR